jgi:methylated-DNA-[protein]-cysteine S-methyltransferase
VEATSQLRAYFAGRLREFQLPLDLRGTDFQLRVWRQLLTIPYGETRSYSQIARAIGAPAAARAVGAANGANPISIVVPCHRVIGGSGKLVGYGGGLALKRRLLDLERAAPLFQ